MKSIKILVSLTACLAFASCSHLTPEQKTQIASYGSAIGAQIINAAAQLGVAKLYGTLPSGSPYAASAANGLRTLQGTTLVTPSDIQATIASFGDPGQPDKWQALGNRVGQIVTNYGAQAVTDTALEAAAIALNQIKVATPAIPPKA